MKDIDKKIVALLYPIFGAFLAFLVFTFGFDGWEFVFTGKPQSLWRGPIGLCGSLAIGAFLGWLAGHHRHWEFQGLGEFAGDTGSAALFGKRVVVILASLVALYFIWRLASSVL